MTSEGQVGADFAKARLRKMMGGVAAVAMVAGFAGHATAQTASTTTAADTAPDRPQSSADIVVTATKQQSTVSRVPISIAVVTRDALDQQSIRNAEDLSRITPSLTISNGNSASGSSVTIRGLASAVGAPTVGIYLDDINITRRNALGAVTGNGTSFPQLFDVDRVEVLRGPQGTLYGGSSIGGTIKFVLPEPSLTTVRLRAKGEATVTKDGDPSIEGGISTAFPLVEDKIGLALSAYARHIGGYIDHVSRFDGRVLNDNTNSQKSVSGRAALLFQVSESFSIKPSFYGAYDKYNDQDQYWTNVDAQTVPGFRVTAPTGTATTAQAGYTTPAYNVFGPYRTGSNCNVGENFAGSSAECAQLSPRKSTLLLPGLTADLQVGTLNFKSITSYTYDKSEGSVNNSFEDTLLFIGARSATGGLSTGILGSNFIPNLSFYRDDFEFRNLRKGWTQEFRVSTDADKPLSLVAGAYYSKFKTDSLGVQNNPMLANLVSALTGFPVATAIQQYYGVSTNPTNFIRQQYLDEKELALFGEATLKLTDSLRVIGGVRFSEVTFSYFESQTGTTVRRLVATPGAGLTQGSVKEKPISPKIALQYFADSKNMFYASATKGFRPGGVTSRPPGTACDSELAGLGFAAGAAAVPFKSDSVWSYEVGAKVRPFGNVLSIDASAYRVDWKDTQVNYRLLCNGSYVANAGKATSKGVDLSAQLAPAPWLNLTATVAYVDAKYDRLGITINNVTTVFINQDDRQPVPKWSYNLGGQVFAPLNGLGRGYLRADYQHAGGYPRSPGPGTNGFFPDVYLAESTDFVSARAGVETKQFDFSIFVNNLFNAQDVLSTNANGGRGGCTLSNGQYTNCARFTPYQKQTTFRPRTVGLTVRYRM
jgi:iron complex outermembrane receptor protein